MLNVGDIVIINELAAAGLPMRIGSRGTIIEKLHNSANYQYNVEFDDGEISPMKGIELNDLTDEIEQYMDYIFINNEVMFDGKKVIILKANYLTNQADILDDIGVISIIEFKELQPLHIDSVEEFDIHEDLLNVFVGHYKNQDNTYTVPKELLINLIKKIYSEAK